MGITWGIILAGSKDEEPAEGLVTGFLNLDNRPVLSYSLSAFEHCSDIDGVVIVAARERLEQVQAMAQLYGCHKIRKIVPGGATYMVCLANGLNYVDDMVETLVLHEASRPGLAPADITNAIKAARKTGCSVVSRPFKGTCVVAGPNQTIDKEMESAKLREIGSPLVVGSDLLAKAIAKAKKNKKTLKHPLDLMFYTGQDLRLVNTDQFPEKISSIHDLGLVEAMIKIHAR